MSAFVGSVVLLERALVVVLVGSRERAGNVLQSCHPHVLDWTSCTRHIGVPWVGDQFSTFGEDRHRFLLLSPRITIWQNLLQLPRRSFDISSDVRAVTRKGRGVTHCSSCERVLKLAPRCRYLTQWQSIDVMILLFVEAKRKAHIFGLSRARLTLLSRDLGSTQKFCVLQCFEPRENNLWLSKVFKKRFRRKHDFAAHLNTRTAQKKRDVLHRQFFSQKTSDESHPSWHSWLHDAGTSRSDYIK